MTVAQYQTRREIIRAEIVDGSEKQASRLGYSRIWGKGEKAQRKPPSRMLMGVSGSSKPIELAVGDYIVLDRRRGHVHYTPAEFNQRYTPYDPRVRVTILDDFDPKIVDKSLDFCILIGDSRDQNMDFAIVGGPSATENVGRFVSAMESKP